MAFIHSSRWHIPLVIVAAFAAIVGSPAYARAQFVSTASIEGTVTDESGGSLPGVTVTASSPALQAGQMTMVTESDGRYRLLQLPAGVYRIKYELSGFQGIVR